MAPAALAMQSFAYVKLLVPQTGSSIRGHAVAAGASAPPGGSAKTALSLAVPRVVLRLTHAPGLSFQDSRIHLPGEPECTHMHALACVPQSAPARIRSLQMQCGLTWAGALALAGNRCASSSGNAVTGVGDIVGVAHREVDGGADSSHRHLTARRAYKQSGVANRCSAVTHVLSSQLAAHNTISRASP